MSGEQSDGIGEGLRISYSAGMGYKIWSLRFVRGTVV